MGISDLGFLKLLGCFGVRAIIPLLFEPGTQGKSVQFICERQWRSSTKTYFWRMDPIVEAFGGTAGFITFLVFISLLFFSFLLCCCCWCWCWLETKCDCVRQMNEETREDIRQGKVHVHGWTVRIKSNETIIV